MNLSLLLLGSSYTNQVFAATRARLVSKAKGECKGITLNTVLMVCGSRPFALIYGLGDSTPAAGACWIYAPRRTDTW